MTSFHDSPARGRPAPPDARLAAAERAANEVLDARAAGASLAAREMLRNAAAKDPLVLEVMRELEETLHLVREPMRGTDVSREVLDRVHSTRPFLAKRARRKVSAARLVLACSLLAGLSTIVVLQRLEPGASTGPVTAALDASRDDAVHSLRSLASAFDRLADSVEHATASSAPSPAPPVRRSLALGDTTRYEGAVVRDVSTPHEYPGVRPFGPGPGLFRELPSGLAIMPGIAQPVVLVGPPSLLLGQRPTAMFRPAPPLLSAADLRLLEQEDERKQTPQPPGSGR